jgi:hypothetical protein
MKWVACAFLAAGAALALAQLNTKVPDAKEPLFKGQGKKDDESTRAVGGVVRNAADEAVDGAVVQLKDTKSLKVRSYITKADGQYRFYGLSTNADYELRADFKGLSSGPKTLSVYDSRRQAVINLKLEDKKKEPEK